MIADQPPPLPTDGPDCWLLVLEDFDRWFGCPLVKEDMVARRQVGLDRYGMPVTPDNGRNHLVDCYQEMLDACVYLRAAIAEGRPANGIYRSLLQMIVVTRRLI